MREDSDVTARRLAIAGYMAVHGPEDSEGYEEALALIHVLLKDDFSRSDYPGHIVYGFLFDDASIRVEFQRHDGALHSVQLRVVFP